MKKILTLLPIVILAVIFGQVHSAKAFTYTGFDSITLDDITAQKGYTITMFNEAIKFGITPNVLTQGGAFEFKEVDPEGNELRPYPELWELRSKILEFDIKNKEYYDPSKPFWLQMQFESETSFEKSLFYYDQGKAEWIKIPSQVNYETGYVRAAFHLPFAKLAVFENTGIMSEGIASWYAYKDCDCAASPDYPKGTQLLVTNTDTGESVVVTVNDWGPERDIFPDRVIDLDVVAFKKIANHRLGLAPVRVEPYVPEVHEEVIVKTDDEEITEIEG